MIEASLITYIADVGFPIVAFLLMWHQSSRTIKENTQILSELVVELRRVK
jgi:hypothetical protein